jgi:hypothetical protein
MHGKIEVFKDEGEPVIPAILGLSVKGWVST